MMLFSVIRPRYFDKKYDLDDPESFSLVKETRENISNLLRENEIRLTGLSYKDILHNKEENLYAKLRSKRALHREDL